MKTTRTFGIGLSVLTMLAVLGQFGTVSGAEPAPAITSISQPQAGDMQILFKGGTGPFTVQKRLSLDAGAAWLDIPTAKVTSVNTGTYVAWIPMGEEAAAFYRVVSAGETIVELKGWTVGLKVSAPANGTHFVAGEQPVVTVNILDNFAQGMTKTSFSSFGLYMYGPEDPRKTMTAWKLLNATTNRSASVHHYIDLKTNAGVTTNGNTLTYTLQPVTDEAAGTYTIVVRAALAADGMQQIAKYATVQIGTSTVESKVFATSKCAECHQGTVSGKLYLHHADVSSRSPFGSWIYDLDPEKSCKMCHNNEGYASFTNTNAPGGRVSDHIVIRVHGVHMGEGLKLPFNINPENGNFHDYTHVVFPADVRNCTACHTDDRWKTKPARLACGACHDNTWFGPEPAPAGWAPHLGGPQANDQFCGFCHSPDTGSFAPVSFVHAVPPVTPTYQVELAMTPPANGQYYVVGEAPQVIVKLKDAGTSQYIDPATIAEPTWSRANLFVSGSRADTVPVLTTAAGILPSTGYYANNDFRVRTNAANADPRVTRTADSVVYQLSTITNLPTGTYTVFVTVSPPSPAVGGNAVLNFQVGSSTVEKFVATSCADCHGNTRMHGSYAFNTDICKSCHDYRHQQTGKTNWSSGNYGFGAGPISRRVHGVHYGKYVEKPLEIHATYGPHYAEVIFPQDVRNCTKCHSESSTWTEKPGRLACFSCHDSNDAIMHGNLMTYDPTPADPWSGDEFETCATCHGKGTEFAPSVVHAISDPYVPPYPRAPRESDPFVTANVARGGQLYDKYWTVKGLAAPVGNHPLWATRPDTTSNTRTGPDTWRCKECHGWDYKGVNGAYGSGSHRTGIRGIFGTTKTDQQVFDLVKTDHGYGAAGLSDWDVWDLVKFVRQGQIDTATVIDVNKKFIGNTAAGETLYNSGIGSGVSCTFCHGANGLTPPTGYPTFNQYPGFLSNDNPWEFLHKVRFGHPGTAMPSAVAEGGTLQNVKDVSAYSQTLPRTP